jgi:long-chain acyl-CoA synthetase
MYPGVHAQTQPDRPAVVMAGSGRSLTYRQLDDRSRRLAHLLRGAGLRRGDHVALLSDNRPEAFEVYWAAIRSGLYITAVNSHLTAPEAAFIVDDCEATAVVVSAGVPVAGEALALVDRPRLRLAYGGAVAGCAEYEAALAGAPDGPLGEQPRGADMLYSSGTTGRPKGIKPPLPDLTVEDPSPFDQFMSGLFGFTADATYLSPAPIYHAAPLRFCAMVQGLGGTVVMLERFDAVAALRAIDEHAVTHSQWVPTMFTRMLKLPDEVRAGLDGWSHRVAIHAAAPCPPEVKRAMIGWWGPILWEYYGATESHGFTAIDSPTWLARPGSVGQALRGLARICGDDGRALGPGEVGTIYFEHAARPFQYHNDPARTDDAAHPEHSTWMTTGDVGRLDEDGYLYLAERQAFVIISGGVNIYPQEIEAVLVLHPKVADAAVIGVPDEDLGEAVTAFVQAAPGAVPGPSLAGELQAHLGERLARYKVPRAVEFVDDLPRTPTGKLVKGKLRERYLGDAHPEPAPRPATRRG